MFAALSFTAAPDVPAQSVILKNAFPLATFIDPVDLQTPPDGTRRVFVVNQPGTITVLPDSSGTTSAKTFLDISAQVVYGGERGLLGLAFHPGYDTNGFFYVNYTSNGPDRSVISRFTVSGSNPDSADPASELVLIEVNQPYSNHNGGQLAFGPDGHLYIALGDGGAGGDPENRAQDLTTILGKILRIDVDSAAPPLNYAIPPDNPWAGNLDGHREEIYAYGLRNPWRFSFDPLDGTGWIGDVGQGEWEEIDILAAGGNYGWRFKEGNHCYEPPDGCDTIAGLIDPVWEYAHDALGGCSVTGGYVYRGTAIPSLEGRYLYGDYCSGRIWSLDTNVSGTWINALVLDSNKTISSFGVGPDGEIFVCSVGDDRVYRLLPIAPPVPSPVSPLDGSTGTPSDPLLRWTRSGSAVAYHLQVADDPEFTFPVVNDSALADTLFHLSPGPGDGVWYWRVRARNDVGWSAFSVAWSFSPDTSTGSALYGVSAGWNLLSLPRTPPDPSKASIFPTAVTPAFRFDPDSGYVQADTLLPGSGYWLKFASAQSVLISGDVRTADTVAIVEGWNLIGGLSGPVPVDGIDSDPPGIVASKFFGYGGSYAEAAALEPARGYWVKASGAGVLILTSALAGRAGNGYPTATADRGASPE